MKEACIHHLAFEATDAGPLRIIAFVEDPDTGAKMVDDIIEVSTDEYRHAHMVISLLARRTLGNVATIRAQWDAPVSRCKTDEARVRKILKAYPGSEALNADMRTLFEAPRDEAPVGF